MKTCGLTLIILIVVLAVTSVYADVENKEDADLDFLPPEANEVNDETGNHTVSIDQVEKQNFTFTLENTYQRIDWREHDKLFFRIPNQKNPDWSNLSQLGIRGEAPLGSSLTFKTSMLFNAYTRQEEDFAISDDLRIDINEAYVSWQQSPMLFVDVGRINVKNGMATGFNPTDYFKVGSLLVRNTEDISELRDDRLGALLIQGQKLWDGGSLTLLVSPKITYKSNRWYSDKDVVGLNLHKTNSHTRVMLKLTHKVSEEISPEWIYYNESGNHNVGLNVSKALNNQWLSYAEWNVGKRRNLIDEALLQARESNYLDPAVAQQFPDDKGEHFQHQLAVGASYTSVSNITTHLEYHYNEAGLSTTDIEHWFEAGSNARYNPAALGQLLSIRELAKARGEPFGKHTLFLRSNWTDAGLDDLDLTGLLIIDLNDNSNLVQAEATYRLNNKASLSLRLAKFQGDKKSNYGSLDKEQTATLQFEYSF